MVSNINSAINTDYLNQVRFQSQNIQRQSSPNISTGNEQDSFTLSSSCTDGSDDGKIGLGSAVGHVLKGGVKFFTGMFTNENGDFSMAQTLKTVAVGAVIASAATIPVVGPLVLPTVCAFGMGDGAFKIVKGVNNAINAKNDADAKAAWEAVGNGTTEGVLSYIGYKKTGGFAKGWEKARAKWNELRNPKVPEPPQLQLPYKPKPEMPDTQHLNSSDRLLVEDAYSKLITPEEQAAYDRGIAYQEPTPTQRKMLDNLADKNAAEYSEAHQIKNNARGVDQLAELREKLAAAEASPKVVPNGEYMLDGNRYVIKDGQIVEMQLKGAQKPQTKVKNIASHNAKSNVLERLANGEGTSTAPAPEPKVASTPKPQENINPESFRTEYIYQYVPESYMQTIDIGNI